MTQPCSNALSMIDTSTCLMVTGRSLMPSTHEASQGAGQRRPGELREVVGGVQSRRRLAPAIAVDEVVPVGDQVAQRTPLVAERNAAVHAAARLAAQRLDGERLVHLFPVADPLLHRTARRRLARELEKSCRPCPSDRHPLQLGALRLERLLVVDRHHPHQPRQRRVPVAEQTVGKLCCRSPRGDAPAVRTRTGRPRGRRPSSRTISWLQRCAKSPSSSRT